MRVVQPMPEGVLAAEEHHGQGRKAWPKPVPAKRRPGRPEIPLSTERREVLLRSFALGMSTEGACAAAGIAPPSFRRWMERAETDRAGTRWPLLREAVLTALAEAERRPLAVLNDVADADTAEDRDRVKAASVLLDRLDRRAGPRMSRDDVAKEIVAPIYDAAGALYRERLAAVVATLRSGLNGSSDSPAARAALDVLAEAMSPASIEAFRVRLAEAASEAVQKAPWRG